MKINKYSMNYVYTLFSCLQPPQCVDVAAVFTDVSVAPPGDPLPHVKGGRGLRKFHSVYVCLYARVCMYVCLCVQA